MGSSKAAQRQDLRVTPIEKAGGKLILSEADCVTLPATLLENIRPARGVQLGDPQVWRTALERPVNA